MAPRYDVFHSCRLHMAHFESVSGTLLDDTLAVVSGVQCLIVCCCDESFNVSSIWITVLQAHMPYPVGWATCCAGLCSFTCPSPFTCGVPYTWVSASLPSIWRFFLWPVVMSSLVPASFRYVSASLGTDWRAMELWCVRTAWIWMSSLLVIYFCIPFIVAFYSFTRFISDHPPFWHGRYILSTSAFLASIQFMHSCFLLILPRSCISSSFQSMTP